MAKTSIIGFPRIGRNRELKSWTENYWKGNLPARELLENSATLRAAHWNLQKQAGIDWIPSNDFSFYDGMLDTAFLLNAIPREYRELGLKPLDTYFAMARGYQGDRGDVKALPMKKWFNTNYHYLIPRLEDDMDLKVTGQKPFEEFKEAQELGIQTRPVLIGPFTFLKLSECDGKKRREDFAASLIEAYREIIRRFHELGAAWIQLDEPSLVMDLDDSDRRLFISLYSSLMEEKGGLKILLQTYFNDLRDVYNEVIKLPFDGIGLDFLEGKQNLSLVLENGFPKQMLLFAGVVNGKNVWRNSYEKTLEILEKLSHAIPKENLVAGTSCSLLHVPYTLEGEDGIRAEIKKQLAFAEEKLQELVDLKELMEYSDPMNHPKYLENKKLVHSRRTQADPAVRELVRALKPSDYVRQPAFKEREKLQKAELNLPPLPTTTIGSFPQTAQVKALRSQLRKKEISEQQYNEKIQEKIASCIHFQEKIGLDVLVHGEFERNDMVEYFGQHLAGFLFTRNAWVQSYGTRCVKPPIIWSDVSRKRPITVETSTYAQSLTSKPVKGMLTGPVTILNWSFPREDITKREMALQIALAIRDEVLDLEAAGLRIIQIDEAALKEKLPLRRADWHSDYLDWAIPAFRLVHSGVKAETQIHTHMCYSEFGEIVGEIDSMDADVISFEASRSDLGIVDDLKRVDFRTEVGPGVYDIHSPRIPSKNEILTAIQSMLRKIPSEKLWINPDCGLKTRGEEETTPSLIHMVEAAKAGRKLLDQ